MKHLGDITKINGWEIEPVDCVTGGSPCQDLSVAGKRAGLAGARSGLFMEQVRVVKELRERDRANGRSGVLIRPRYMVWENVPGAFSSNRGQDFRVVLEEIVRIAEPDAPDVPMPAGGWPGSGCLYDELGRWSVAWRLHDAQFWGVPQRRKRIALIADFGGLSEPEILFEREGLSWDSDESAEEKEEAAARAGESAERSDLRTADTSCGSQGQATAACPAEILPGEQYIQATVRALTARNDGSPCVDRGPEVMPFDTTQITSKQNGSRPDYGDPCHPLAAQAHPPAIVEAMSFQERAGKPGGGKGILIQEEKTGAISAAHEQYVAAFSGGQGEKVGGIGYQEEVTPSLKAVMSGGNTVPTIVTYDARGNDDGETVCTTTGDHESRVTDYTAHDQQAVLIAAVDCRNGTENPYTNGMLQAKESGGISVNYQNVVQAFSFDSLASNSMKSANPISGCREVNIAKTLDATRPDPSKNQGGIAILQPMVFENHEQDNVVRENESVRRLTPLECERLQGYPDNWTRIGELIGFTVWTDENDNEYPDAIYKYVGPDGKTYKTSDTARYKALGNSIALPFWFWLLRRISAQYERPATLGSLFDGIGGFPLCWERCNGKGTARWASEIEPFPIAVTSYHFSEGNT